MSTTDPQFVYMILVLPSLFGLTLLGEGLNKVFHEDMKGLLPVIFGCIFLGTVIFAYFFFSSYMATHKAI